MPQINLPHPYPDPITTTANISYPSFSLSNGSGSILTNASSNVYSWAPDMDLSGTMRAKDVEIDGVSMKELMKILQDRLAILIPDPEKLEKYEALKKAYEQYKMLEALINEDNLKKEDK